MIEFKKSEQKSMSLQSIAGFFKQVRGFLKESGVDLDAPQWQDGSKIDSLAKELRQGKCFLVRNSFGLHRCVNVVVLRLWSPDRKFMLVDMGCKYPSGEEEWGAQLPGHKRESDESAEVVVLRVCKDMLGLNESDLEFSGDTAWEYFETSKTSK